MSENATATPAKTPASKSPPRTPGVRVRVRNAAVHILYRRLIAVALVAFLAAASSVTAMFAIIGKPVPPVYIPITDDGRLLPLIPMEKPNMDHGGLGEFALRAVRAVNTYDYINWRDQLSAAETFFSPQGWNAYQKNFKQSNTINAVIDRRMIVSVRPTGTVKFIREGVSRSVGSYVWQVDVPVEVTYTAHVVDANQSSDPGSQLRGDITLYISRVPTTVNQEGVAVQIYIFTLAPTVH